MSPGTIHSIDQLSTRLVQRSDKCKILVALSNKDELDAIVHELNVLDFDIISATNGKQAIDNFQNFSPDIVLLDTQLTVKDGFETAATIRFIAEDIYFPIVFIISDNESPFGLRALVSTATDYFVRPYKIAQIQSKLELIYRRTIETKTLKISNQKLTEEYKQLKLEYEVSQRMLSKLTAVENKPSDYINSILSPQALSNGDIFLSETTNSNKEQLLLGDITGHGLSAAIGCIPVVEVFRSMTTKNLALEDIILEINNKIYEKFPTELFLTAYFVEYNPEIEELTIWNFGSCDALLLNTENNKIKRIASLHPPIGLHTMSKSNLRNVKIKVSCKDYLYLYSDGVIESENGENEAFGIDRLIDTLKLYSGEEKTLDNTLQVLREFRGGSVQTDDVALVEFHCY